MVPVAVQTGGRRTSVLAKAEKDSEGSRAFPRPRVRHPTRPDFLGSWSQIGRSLDEGSDSVWVGVRTSPGVERRIFCLVSTQIPHDGGEGYGL